MQKDLRAGLDQGGISTGESAARRLRRARVQQGEKLASTASSSAIARSSVFLGIGRGVARAGERALQQLPQAGEGSAQVVRGIVRRRWAIISVSIRRAAR